MEQILTEQIAQKVIDTVKPGLSSGLGNNNPGEMCVEAAVCYAYGLEHSDNPPCVGKVVRSFKIKLNDSNWSSNKTRAEGMIKIAVAQLGSNVINQYEFAKRIVLKTINTIIADIAKIYLPEKEQEFRKVNDLNIAKTLCLNLKNATYAADYAINAINAVNAGYTTLAAAYTAYAACTAANSDEGLIKSADICLEVLKEMNSPGCQYLYLLDK